jgi:hypothetical protein
MFCPELLGLFLGQRILFVAHETSVALLLSFHHHLNIPPYSTALSAPHIHKLHGAKSGLYVGYGSFSIPIW